MVIKKAYGCYIEDMQGNKFIDTSMGAGSQIIGHDNKLIRKIISGFYEFAQYIFPIGPKLGLFFAAKKYLNDEKVDAIIATGDPFVLFKYAADLGEEFKVPWIADYRDPWSEDIAIQRYFIFHIRKNREFAAENYKCKQKF